MGLAKISSTPIELLLHLLDLQRDIFPSFALLKPYEYLLPEKYRRIRLSRTTSPQACNR